MNTIVRWLQVSLVVGLVGCASGGAVGKGKAGAEGNELPPTVQGEGGVGLRALGEGSTLEDYLAWAALNNPELEAKFNQWQAALQKVPQARTLPDPRISYGYYIREVETRVGPQQHRLGVSQTFPWFGKLRLRGGVAEDEAEAARQRYEMAKLDLFYRVKSGYHELHYLRRALAITEGNIELLKHLESVAEARFRAGAAYTGVIKAQVELSRLTDQLRSLRDLRDPLVARLNAALNRPPDTCLPWPGEVVFRAVQLEGDLLEAWLVERNPELEGLALLVEKEVKAASLARKEYYPDFTLGVDYIPTGEAVMPLTPDSGKDPLMATVSINLPLWWRKYRAGVREAEAREQAAGQSLTNRRNTLLADLRMALYRFRDAERRMSLYRDTLLPQANSALEVAEQSYESGKTDFLNLIDAQRLLLEFQLQNERALADREQRLAEIEMLVGRKPPAAAGGDVRPADPGLTDEGGSP